MSLSLSESKPKMGRWVSLTASSQAIKNTTRQQKHKEIGLKMQEMRWQIFKQKQSRFETLLNQIVKYYLSQKDNNDHMNDQIESVDLLIQVDPSLRVSEQQVKEKEQVKLKKLQKLLHRDLAQVSKQSGARVQFQFLNSQNPLTGSSTTSDGQINSARGYLGGNYSSGLNSTIDYSQRFNTDDSFTMASTNTSMILPKSDQEKKKGGFFSFFTGRKPKF